MSNHSRRLGRNENRARINGHVTDEDGFVVSDVRIEVFLRTPDGDDRRLSTTKPDAEGRFAIPHDLSPRLLDEPGRRPVLYFRVWHGDQRLLDTSDAPSRVNLDEEIRLELSERELERARERAENEPVFSVRGRIVHPDGKPARELLVSVSAVEGPDPEDETRIDEGETDENGEYAIRYEVEQDREDGFDPPDLTVRAYEADEFPQDEPVASSPIVLAPAPHQIIDLVVGDEPYRGPSEFDQLRTAIDPLVSEPDIEDEPSAGSIRYLATKTSFTPGEVSDYLRSRRLEEQSDAPAPAFYAMLRDGLPGELTALAGADTEARVRAIEGAADTNVVPPSTVEHVDRIAETLNESAVDRLVSAPADGDAPTLEPVLNLTDLASDDQRTLLRRYQAHDGSAEDFWAELRDSEEWGPDRVRRIQTALQVGILTGYDGGMSAVLMEEFADEEEPLRAIARLESDTLAEMFVAEGVFDEEESGDAGASARRISRVLEGAFPGWVLAHRIEDDEFEHAVEIAGFLKEHPEIDFRSIRLDSYLAENGDDVPPELGDSLRSVQRLFNIAPVQEPSRTIRVLLSDDVHSAYALQRRGKAALSTRYADQLEETEIDQLYANVTSVAGKALNLYASHAPQLNDVPVYAIDGLDGVGTAGTAGEDILDTEELFGSLDLCACEHCRSIYSPAAYMVDLLAWLNDRPAVRQLEDGTIEHRSDRTMLDVLSDRRPDLTRTELTCENTNTSLPYIDLVNEVLENQVAGTSETYQTEWAAETLRVQPEHLNPDAYDRLAEAAYPWHLPFDLWLEEARTYLGQLGVERAELLGRFGSDAGDPGAAAVATERLGLTERDRRLVVGESAEDDWVLWGWDSNANWKVDLDTVSTLLDHSGLSYDALEDLLHARYLNPTGAIRIQHDGPDCDLDDARLVNRPENGFFSGMHRFVRLARHLGWTHRQLDTALAAIDPHQLTEPFLNRLGTVVAIGERTGTDIEEVLSWFGRLDTHDWGEEPSLYARRFLDESVANPTEASFELVEDGSELADTSQTVEDHVDAIRAALGVTAEVLDLLIETQLGDAAPPGGHQLSLESLSRLYRVVSLAETVDLSVEDLVVLLDLSGQDPFDASSPDGMLAFIEEVDRVQGSDFDVAELDYLLRHGQRAGSPVAATDEVVSRTLTGLRDGLQALEAEYQIAEEEPLGDQAADALSVLLSEEEVARAIALLEQRSAESEADLEDFITSAFGTFLDPTTARNELLPFADDAVTEERYRFVLEPLLEYLLRIRREDYIVQQLSDALDSDPGVVSLLLREILPSESAATDPVIEDYFDPGFLTGTDESLDLADVPAVFAGFRRLEKVLRLLEGFGIPEREVAWLIEYGPDFGLTDLRTLPIANEGGDPTARFEGWLRIQLLEELRPTFGKSEGGIVDLLEAIRAEEDETTLHRRITRSTGWTDAEVTFFLGPDGFGSGLPDTTTLDRSLSVLQRLSMAFETLERLGTSAETAVDWARTDPTFEQARAIKQSVRAQYDEDRWFEVAEPLRDDLRDDQREALVTYLVEDLSDEGVSDAEDLFGRFLLDTEMTSCMLTSRIKQALASIQLFVQRSQMNLEAECVLSEDDEREWEWRKKYRVWEANRKVFLYPENWIRPELRRDKSPFFEELESELLQAEVNDDNVERVYLNYLEKLDDVARLEIIASYLEGDDEESETFHVVGRTRDTPNRYFYRRFEDGSRWTPWEPIEVDIEGDHIIPVVFNRRLRILWPIIVPKAEEGAARTDSSEASEPNRRLEIQLAWSELRNGKWTPKRVTDATLSTAEEYPKSDISFGAAVLDGRLVVAAYNEHYTPIGSFRFTGSGDQVLLGTGSLLSSYMLAVMNYNRRLQPDTEPWYNGQREGSESGDDLELYAVPPSRNEYTVSWGSFHFPAYNNERTVVLDATPGRFELVLPQQIPVYRSQAPLFFQDEDRVFFVRPYRTSRPVARPGRTWVNVDEIIPEIYERVDEPIPEELIDPPILGGGDVDPVPVPWDPSVAGGLVVGGEDRPVTPIMPDSDGTTLPMETGMEMEVGAETLSLPLPDTTLGPAPTYAADFEAEAQAMYGVSSEYRALSYTDAVYEHDFAIPINEMVTNYRFDSFYHPYVGRFIEQLNRYGIEGFLAPTADQDTHDLARQVKEEPYFEARYVPTSRVDDRYPVDEIDFERGAYSLYNWELFFHGPTLVASQLSRNRKFQEAQEWLHYVFNPTVAAGGPVPNRFWNIKPFYENPGGRSIHELLALLTRDDLDTKERQARENLEQQIREWEDRPFEPHVIARLRQIAYQRSVVMQYLDNLLDWGDELFRRGSLEDLNEATQIYMLAKEILGDRPELVSRSDDDRTVRIDGEPVNTFEGLADHLDEHIHAIVELETPLGPSSRSTVRENGSGPDFHLGPVFFFCLPRNEKLLGYWDTVEDRLYKIRHCLNIEGTFQLPALFEAPIDPGVLVEAAAAGVDISSVLSDLNAPLPNYRFRSMIQTAQGVTHEVQALGASLLQTLEKRDAEELALLRSGQEISVLEATTAVRELRIEEMENAVAALEKNRELVQARRDYYQTREYMNAREQEHERRQELSHTFQNLSQVTEMIATTVSLIPEFDAGGAGISSPLVKARFGGANLSAAIRAASSQFRLMATFEQQAATMAQTKGSYDRRAEDWGFQADQAATQLEEIDEQITASKIRLDVAEKELENHELQIANAQEVSDFMESKFTNEELYSWMISQLSGVYYQSYQLARSLAKQCERAYQHELADWDASFVEFGHWDSLRKGLLAGERLSENLRQMDASYQERNRREHELTKHVSLSTLDPVAVEMLRKEGICHVSLPEVLFDIDHPGHYMRRIKSVSLSIPCVTGPYTNVPAELTLLSSEIRTTPEPAGPNDGNYVRDSGDAAATDSRFRDVVGTAESIVTSSANRDSGLFETDLQDERYLPFEGAGALSTWRIELPTELRPFDFDTISDVVIHVRYTARDGGKRLKDAAVAELRSSLNAASRPETGTGLFEAVSLARDTPDAWHQLSTPPGDNVTEIDVGTDRFPAMFRGEGIEIGAVTLLMDVGEPVPGGTTVTANVTASDGSPTEISLTPSSRLEGVLEGSTPDGTPLEAGIWELELTQLPDFLAADDGRLDPVVEDIVLVLGYQIGE